MTATAKPTSLLCARVQHRHLRLLGMSKEARMVDCSPFSLATPGPTWPHKTITMATANATLLSGVIRRAIFGTGAPSAEHLFRYTGEPKAISRLPRTIHTNSLSDLTEIGGSMPPIFLFADKSV